MSDSGNVPFVDHTIHWKHHKKQYLQVFDEVLSTGKYQGDDTSTHFEAALQRKCGFEHAVLVGSGTEALYLSLRALDTGKSEVIVPAFSFPATASAVVRAGKTPVFVDVGKNGVLDFNTSFNRVVLDDFTTPNTEAIIPVAMFGRVSSLPKSVVKGMTVIGDYAQTLKVPVSIPFATVSFDPMKPLPAFGSAGAILCDDTMVDFMLRGLRKNSPYTEHPSQNSQVPAIISAALTMSMKMFYSHWGERRDDIAEKYKRKLPLSVQDDYYGETSNHKFPIYYGNRDKMKQYLASKGIETKVHYPYVLPELVQFGGMPVEEVKEKFPMAYKLSRNELSLPIFPQMTDEQIDYVCSTVTQFLEDEISIGVNLANPIHN